ncbi:biotin carboxylase [Achromobacter spanius]|uniref:biotin carboxylase n=1 Tax=Achromobacter spanius TaxID=217203 RepID=UPI00382A24EA
MPTEDPIGPVAVFYQATPAPLIDGVRKDPKPGGYSDSGADIAFCLMKAGVAMVVPCTAPSPERDLDWVFPDTAMGFEAAAALGAETFWANTVLFKGHPIEQWTMRKLIVGQRPERQQAADDKYATNKRLRELGLPVATSIEVGLEGQGDVVGIGTLSVETLSSRGLCFPLVVKPVRGRGSQGVSIVHTFEVLVTTLGDLLSTGKHGGRAIVEQYLPGEELTITVLPGVAPFPLTARPFALPPVRRFNHVNGVAPYNGTVAVTSNSAALSVVEIGSESVQKLVHACVEAFDAIEAAAPIRIDCRSDPDGVYRMFDLNMKPNMTGSGRPGREDQDSLSLIAARALGWSYTDLLQQMLASAWTDAR